MIVMLLLVVMVCQAQDDQPFPSQTALGSNAQEIVLTIEEAQRIVAAWDRIELQLRAAREDTSNDPAAQSCCNDADLAAIRTCICAIKNQLCVVTGLIGACTDTVIPEITNASCVTQDDINAICASLQSWIKTIVSELRCNQITCP